MARADRGRSLLGSDPLIDHVQAVMQQVMWDGSAALLADLVARVQARYPAPVKVIEARIRDYLARMRLALKGEGHNEDAFGSDSGTASGLKEGRSRQWRTGEAGSGRAPDVAILPAADFGNRDDRAALRRLNGPSVGCVLVERKVRARRVIIHEGLLRRGPGAKARCVIRSTRGAGGRLRRW